MLTNKHLPRYRFAMWILIDNYDSFTHILWHYLLQAGAACVVLRNDETTLAELIELKPARLIISPGPGRPEDAGITMAAIQHFTGKIPLLGVCLGHQAMGLLAGATLTQLPTPVHGKTSELQLKPHPLLAGIGQNCPVMRYHSLHLTGLHNTEYEVLATAANDGAVMAMAHRKHPNTGVQFHPESILTAHGQRLINNWAAMHTAASE